MPIAPLIQAVLLSLLLCADLAPVSAQAPAGAGAPERHPVTASLLVDRTSVTPGGTVRLGILLRMEEAWHTYWAFGGDAGLPTQVEWRLPAGLQAGPLQWPAPHKYEEAGGLTVYGYADEVLLITEVSVPDTLTPGRRLEVSAAVSWLVCRQICIPGDTVVVAPLEVAAEPGEPAHAGLFASHLARVPSPHSDADPIAWRFDTRTSGDGLDIDLVLRPRGDGFAVTEEFPDFFPLADETFHVEAGSREVEEGGRAILRFAVVPYGSVPPTVLSGVLAYRPAGGGDLEYRAVQAELAPAPAPVPAIDLLGTDFAGAVGPAGGRPLASYLLMALAGGLILNLMPCVLPVISLKVLSFVSQAGEEAGRIRQLGLAFSAGIVATFVGLALAAVAVKAGGEQIGWGFQFQSPGFVIFLAAFVFLLALSLFGVVTVRLPGTGSSFGGLADRESLGSSFFNGVVATILATPCTAPFLGAALGFAFTQTAPVTVGVFAATGVGMALPYLLLAVRPGWTRWLPRPGVWMERFKQVMGFPLMATVLWLLWVLGKQLGMEAVVWTGAFLLALSLSAWLVGQWLDLRSSRRRRAVGWLLAVTIAATSYGYFVQPLLRAEAQLARAANPGAGGTEGDGLQWEPFSIRRTEELLASGRPVFIDFTAEWCWTCKVNERTVLADEEVRRRLAELDVALIKADWTNRNPEITSLLQAFGRSGVPLYVVFPPGRPEAPIVLPEVITPGMVIEALERAVSPGDS